MTDNVLPDWLPTTSVQEHQDCSGPDCPDKTFCSEQNCAGQDILFRTKLSWTRHTVQNQTVQDKTYCSEPNTVQDKTHCSESNKTYCSEPDCPGQDILFRTRLSRTRHTVQNQTVQDKTYYSEPDCPGQDILFRTRLSRTRHIIQNQTVQDKTHCSEPDCPGQDMLFRTRQDRQLRTMESGQMTTFNRRVVNYLDI